MISSYKNIYIISTDKQFITSIRKNIYCDTLSKESNTKIALIDRRKESNTSISYIEKVRVCRKIHIINNLSYKRINKLLDHGTDYIISDPINVNLLNGVISKFQGSNEFIEYHGLKLYLKDLVLEYKQCRINITKIEALIIKALIFNKGFCSLERLCEYARRDLTSNYIQVIVTRINNKSKLATGIKIIKNRYGLGYRIAI